MTTNKIEHDFGPEYCPDCTINHNCTVCPRMYSLVIATSSNVNNILDLNWWKKKKETSNNSPRCWECGSFMRKSKFKNWPRYYCSNCKK